MLSSPPRPATRKTFIASAILFLTAAFSAGADSPDHPTSGLREGITTGGFLTGAAALVLAFVQWRKAGADEAVTRERLNQTEKDLKQFKGLARRRRRQVIGIKREFDAFRGQVSRGLDDSKDRIFNVESELATIRELKQAGLLADSGDDMPSWPGNPPLVLVVDDDRATTKAFGKVLMSHGFAVALAFTLDDALRQLDEIRPDWMLVDLCLGPTCDGIDAIKKAREVTPNTRHMVITGLDDQEKLKEAEALGAMVIMKPIRGGLKSLLETLKRLPRPGGAG